MKYRFLDFELDSERVRVSRGNVVLRLRPKCYDLLLYLLQRPRTLATKHDLLSGVWPEVTVQEASLAQCVAQLRETLAPEGPNLIRTVAKRGYILEADVEMLGDPVSGNHKLAWRVPQVARQAALLGFGLAFGYLVAEVATPAAALPRSFADGFVLDSDKTSLGQALTAVAGPVAIRAEIKSLPPGGVSRWHSHEDIVFAFVLNGEVISQYENGETLKFGAGNATVEATGLSHQARNPGREPVKILVVTYGPAKHTGVGPANE